MAIASAAAPSSIGSDPTVVLVTIRPGFELGGVLTIRIDGHDGCPIVVFAGLRTDAEPGDVNEALGLLRDIDGATNDTRRRRSDRRAKESERPSVNRRGTARRCGGSYDLTMTVLS